MIVLDTNVLSELMRAAPNPNVVRWVASRPRRDLYTTSVSEAEIMRGIAMLPAGRRQSGLAAAARALFSEDFSGRSLPFGSAAVPHYAVLVAARRAAGRPIAAFAALIAAIARDAGAQMIATRDLAGFADCGVNLSDPWAS